MCVRARALTSEEDDPRISGSGSHNALDFRMDCYFVEVFCRYIMREWVRMACSRIKYWGWNQSDTCIHRFNMIVKNIEKLINS